MFSKRIVTLLSSQLIVVGAAALAAPFDDEARKDAPTASKAAPQFGDKVRVATNVGFATSLSQDQKVMTLLYDNMLVEVSPVAGSAAGAAGQTAVQSKLVTFEIPYTTDQKKVKMTVDLRGYLNVDAAAKVRLVVCGGDATKLVDLSTEEREPVEFKGKSKEAVVAEHPGVKFGDFHDRIEFTVHARAAKPVCPLTLLLIAEHDTDAAGSGGALLALDSLDLTISEGGKAAYRP